ncbi:MAG TPA: oligosaccharide flippase family protein [Aeromicrobium sp.]|nr:oligosaccharide flippase family protein [Aeromicrobium sp.]
MIERARTTAYVAGGQVTMNVAAYVFSLVAARILIPAEFGAVTALLSILQMGVVASLGLQAAAARRMAVAPSPADRDATIGIVLRSTTLVSLMVGGAVAVASPVIVWILHLDSLWPALLCSLALVPLTAMGGFIGIAQGAERWQAVTAIALANGFGRLLAGVVALLIHPSVVSALIGIAIGAWAPVLVGVRILGFRAVRDPFPGTLGVPGGTLSRRPLLREALAGTHTLFAFYVLSNLDALVARNRLDAHEAGLYAAGLILSKAALMAPSFVGVLLYPRLATDETAASLRLAVSLVAGVGLIATVATALLPKLALVLAGGGQYAEVAQNLWLFTLAGSVWSIVQVLVLDSLARRRSGVAILTWFAVVTLPVLAVITNVGVTGLILIVGMVGAALSLVLSLAPRDRG